MKLKNLFVPKKIYSVLLATLCFAQSALAASEMLCSTKLKQPEGELKAELWGEVLKGGYSTELVLLLKKEDGTLVTAYTPDIRGGYNPYLKALKLKGEGKEKQLLLAVGEGNWKAATGYRVYDLQKPEEVKVIFNAEDNLGVVNNAVLEGNNLKVTLMDERSYDVGLIPELVPEKLRGNGRLDFQKLHSLTVYGGNSDGKDILITNQQIMADKKLLADVGAIFYYKESEQDEAATDKKASAEAVKEKIEETSKEATDKSATKEGPNSKYWKISNFAIMSNSSADKKNHINDGIEFSKAIILPRKMLLGRKEATYPLVVCPGKPELAEKMNELLEKEGAPYYKGFFRMEKDVAFDVNWASSKLLAIQFICGGENIVHHQVNIDPETGKKLELKDIINVKDKDLLPLLNLLKTNELVTFEELPKEWYIANDRLYLLQRVNNQDYASSYSLEDLNKFIIDEKWKK